MNVSATLITSCADFDWSVPSGTCCRGICWSNTTPILRWWLVHPLYYGLHMIWISFCDIMPFICVWFDPHLCHIVKIGQYYEFQQVHNFTIEDPLALRRCWYHTIVLGHGISNTRPLPSFTSAWNEVDCWLVRWRPGSMRVLEKPALCIDDAALK